jgi:hypothetical protein
MDRLRDDDERQKRGGVGRTGRTGRTVYKGVSIMTPLYQRF